MKSLLTLIAFFTVQQLAFAEGVTAIKKGDVSIAQARAEIIGVSPVCPDSGPEPTCAAYGSVVKVKVYLNGCLDRFGGHFSKFDLVDGKGVLSFGALNIFNERSRVAMCVAIPTRTVEVYVPFEGEIELAQLEYNGTTLPMY